LRRRRWTCFEDSASFWAAPWWALTWVLTFGRNGKLPWEWEEIELATMPGRAFCEFTAALVRHKALTSEEIEAVRRQLAAQYSGAERGRVTVLEPPPPAAVPDCGIETR
jgi:hypothetical protein